MSTRREALRSLACLPLLLRGDWHSAASPPDSGGGAQGQFGFACALGEQADARDLPAPRRRGEHLVLALAGTARPSGEDLLRCVGAPDAQWLELSHLDRGGVEDGPLAERLRLAASVSLIEGPMLDWLITLWPARRSSAVLHALSECAAGGGRVSGRGSTAFLIAAGGVARGPSREASGESRLRSTNPREHGEPRLTPGLCLGGAWILDTHARAGGSALRLLSCLIEAHLDEGVLLGPRSLLCCDLETRAWTALGSDPLLHLDLKRSRRLPHSVEGARLSVLAAGDGWSRRERRLFSPAQPAACAAQDGAGGAQVADALAMEQLLAAPQASRSWRDARLRVELACDDSTRVLAGARAHRMRWSVALEHGSWGELG